MSRAAMMIVSLGLSACASETACEGPTTVVDTSGTKLRFDREGCIIVADASTPEPTCQDPDEASIVAVYGRFVGVAITCGNVWTSFDIRFLACETDDDCPELRTDAPWFFECRAGLCQNVDTETYPPDLVVPYYVTDLCNARFPRGTGYQGPDPCPGVPEDAACPFPLPPECIDPR